MLFPCVSGALFAEGLDLLFDLDLLEVRAMSWGLNCGGCDEEEDGSLLGSGLGEGDGSLLGGNGVGNDVGESSH